MAKENRLVQKKTRIKTVRKILMIKTLLIACFFESAAKVFLCNGEGMPHREKGLRDEEKEEQFTGFIMTGQLQG